MKTKNQQHYLKLVRKTLDEITMTPRDQGARFLILKKRAQRYLKKAREFEVKK